jgi:hypothetical protein
MMTEARHCGLIDKSTYDCKGRMGSYCDDCNLVIETVADLPECRLCQDRVCVQINDIVCEFRANRLIKTYDGQIDNCSHRRYIFKKQL